MASAKNGAVPGVNPCNTRNWSFNSVRLLTAAVDIFEHNGEICEMTGAITFDKPGTCAAAAESAPAPVLHTNKNPTDDPNSATDKNGDNTATLTWLGGAGDPELDPGGAVPPDPDGTVDDGEDGTDPTGGKDPTAEDPPPTTPTPADGGDAVTAPTGNPAEPDTEPAAPKTLPPNPTSPQPTTTPRTNTARPRRTRSIQRRQRTRPHSP